MTTLPFLEVEIPAFYVDRVTESALSTPYLANMIPDAGYGQGNGPAPAAATYIDFDLIDFGADGIDAANTTVKIDGVNAILNGVVQGGFTGALTTPSSDTLHVHVKPNAPFASSHVVIVRVITRTLVSFHPLDQSYSFTIADTIAPSIVAAAAQDTEEILVSWSEAVRQLSATGANDALNPARYALAPTLDGLHPAVTPVVVAVSTITSSSVLLETDVELSPGITYTLTETGVADLSGNTGTSSAQFIAFVPPKPARRVWDLYRKLPEKNRIEDDTKDLLRFVLCLQEVADLLIYDVDKWTDILDPDIAPDNVLDAMLEDLGNPFPFVLTTTGKRQLLRVLVSLYKQDGTAPGIINAVRFFTGLTVTISSPLDGASTMRLGSSRLGVDWILGSGDRRLIYSFNIVSAVALDADQTAKVTWIANFMKPTRTHFLGILVPTTPPPYDPMVLGRSRLGVDWLLH